MLRQKKKKLLGNLHKFTELNLLSGEKKSKQNTTPKGEHRFLKITFSTGFFFFWYFKITISFTQILGFHHSSSLLFKSFCDPPPSSSSNPWGLIPYVVLLYINTYLNNIKVNRTH